MVSLFVPGATPGAPTQRAYDELRGYAEARTGQMARGDAIFALSCRRGGTDSDTRVGEPDPCTGHIVLAIFASRDGYTIVWRGGHDNVSRRATYEAILFD
jgi:hypothetical protein